MISKRRLNESPANTAREGSFITKRPLNIFSFKIIQQTVGDVKHVFYLWGVKKRKK